MTKFKKKMISLNSKVYRVCTINEHSVIGILQSVLNSAEEYVIAELINK